MPEIKKLPFLVDLQQKLRKLVLSMTYSHVTIILENALN
jgi:hypothetical protein